MFQWPLDYRSFRPDRPTATPQFGSTGASDHWRSQAGPSESGVPELRPQGFDFGGLVWLRIIERLIRDVPAAAALLPAYLQRADAPKIVKLGSSVLFEHNIKDTQRAAGNTTFVEAQLPARNPRRSYAGLPSASNEPRSIKSLLTSRYSYFRQF